MDTSTLDQVEPIIETPTFWFVDNLHEPLSYWRPSRFMSTNKLSANLQ